MAGAYKVKLVHEKLNFVLEQRHNGYKNTMDAVTFLKHKYGKKFYECSLFVNGVEIDKYDLVFKQAKKGTRLSRKIRNLKTGDIYETIQEAANDIGVYDSTIRKHLNRGLSEENHFMYLVAWV
jgi:hypothetical protein